MSFNTKYKKIGIWFSKGLQSGHGESPNLHFIYQFLGELLVQGIISESWIGYQIGYANALLTIGGNVLFTEWNTDLRPRLRLDWTLADGVFHLCNYGYEW
jgi:hypothetical protein